MVPLHVDGMLIRTFNEAVLMKMTINSAFHARGACFKPYKVCLGDILCLLALISENLLVIVHIPLLQEYH